MKRKTSMKSTFPKRRRSTPVSVVSGIAFSCLLLLCAASQARAQTPANQKTFATADEAADALVAAADPLDVAVLKEILGPDSYDIVNTGEPARDKEVTANFASMARTKKNVIFDPRNARRA